MIVGGHGIKVNKVANQVIIDAYDQGSGYTSLPTIHTRVETISGDYLVCDLWDERTATYTTETLLQVMKPYMLRVTPLNGEAITYPNGDTVFYRYDAGHPEYLRVAYEGGSSTSSNYETQQITPIYVEGEIIRAILGAPSYGYEYVWEDVNTCGRHWAKVTT